VRVNEGLSDRIDCISLLTDLWRYGPDGPVSWMGVQRLTKEMNMKRVTARQLSQALLAVGLLLAGTATAQDSRVRVRVSNIKVDLKTVRTPIFQSTSNPQATSEYEWLQVYVEYETEAARRWADEVTITWSLLVRPTNTTKPILLQETATYVDVADGKHHAVMYVRPGFIRRYCDTRSPNKSHFAAYAEISCDGKILAQEEFSRSTQPKNWWRAKEPDVRLIEGELMPPDLTPFAPLDYDFYEHPNPKRQ
jgi:hypothetical protein